MTSCWLMRLCRHFFTHYLLNGYYMLFNISSLTCTSCGCCRPGREVVPLRRTWSTRWGLRAWARGPWPHVPAPCHSRTPNSHSVNITNRFSISHERLVLTCTASTAVKKVECFVTRVSHVYSKEWHSGGRTLNHILDCCFVLTSCFSSLSRG